MLTALKLVKESPNHLIKMRKATNLGSLSIFANTKRTFATATSQKKAPLPRTNNHSLKTEFPGTPKIASEMGVPLAKPETKITILPNGLRVVTEETFTQTSSVALFIDAGTAYETNENRGISHMMERMAFKTTKTRDQRSIIHELEEMGGNVTSSSSREMLGFAADVVREYVPRLLAIMADNVVNPLYLEEELAEQKEVIAHEIEETSQNPPQYLPELLHETAIKGPLGRSMFVPPKSLEVINSEHLRKYHHEFYRPDRMVLAVAGDEHERVVELAKKLFKFEGVGKSNVVRLPSKYVGGDLNLPRDPNEKIKPQDNILSHLLLAFEAPSMMSSDIYAVAVINTLFGGGGSFSAGGPGKGMYSRLYRNVLNGNNFVEQANAFMSPYSETGIWGISASVVNAKLPEIMQSLLIELLQVAMSVDNVEFNRAKNQLKSQIFMSLESRASLADDIGRQVLTYGKRNSAEEVGKKIDELQTRDIQRVMKTMLTTKLPTIVSYGEGAEMLPDAKLLREFYTEHLKFTKTE